MALYLHSPCMPSCHVPYKDNLTFCGPKTDNEGGNVAQRWAVVKTVMVGTGGVLL